MTGEISDLLAKLRAGLERIYGPRLKGLYLFGSHARGEADAESDVDVLIVLDDYAQYIDEVRRTSELRAGVSLDHRTSVTTVFVTHADWLAGETPFLFNVRQEAVTA